MERYTEIIITRVTKGQLEHLKKCSSCFIDNKFKNGKENFSEYIREKLLLETNYKNQMLERQMKNLQYELRKIGTNINQVTRKINGEFGTPKDLEELKYHQKQIEKKFDEFKQEVKHIWQSQN